MRFFLVNSEQQYRQIVETRPDLIRTHVPVTVDMAVAAHFEDAGTPFYELWDYISSEELERNWELASDITRHWHGIGSDDLEFFGAYPLRSSSVEMLPVCETALNANLAFQRLLAAERPTEIVGVGDTFAVYRYGPAPLTRGTGAIAEAVAHWHCDQAGIAFSRCALPAPQVKRLRGAPLHRQRIAMASPDLQKQGAAEDPLLVIVDLSQNPDELFELERGLRRLGRFRIARLTELLRPGYPIRPSLSPRNDEMLEACAARSAHFRQAYEGPYPFLFRNPHLEYQFQAVWKEVRRSCDIASSVAPLLHSLRPEAVLLGADCFTSEGLIRDIAMSAGIVVGVLLHSGFGVSRGWKDLCSPADVTFAWGNLDRLALEFHGAPPERVTAVGSLRYFEANPAESGRLPASASKRIVDRLGLGSTRRVVSLLTAQTNHGFSWSSSEPRQHRVALGQFLSWARRNPDIGVILKPHPSYDHLEWYRYLERSFPSNVTFAEGENLNDVLAVSDAAILLNYCTTAALPAMPRMPIVFARSGYRSTPSQASSLDGDCVLQASSVAELTQHLEHLLRDDSFWNSRVQQQRAFLAQVFHDRGRHPAVHIAEALSARFATTDRMRAPAHGERPDDEETEIMAELWKPNPEAMAVRWGACFSRSAPARRVELLLMTAIVLAARARPPAELGALVATFRRQIAGKATTDEQERFMLGVFLSAMSGALARHRWLEVLALARETIRRLGATALRSRYFWRVTSRAVASYGFADRRSVLAVMSAGALGRSLDADSPRPV
jgi:hypothetical protein